MKSKSFNFLFSGLPHLLYAASLYIPHILTATLGLYLDWWIVSRIFWIILAVGLVGAWRQGWLRWSGTWLGFLLVLLIDQLVGLFPEGLLGSVAILLFFLVSWLAIYRIAQADPIQSLLAIPPAAALWLWYASLDNVRGVVIQGLIFLWCGLALGLASAMAERQSRTIRAIAWLAGGILLGGLPVAAGEIYMNILPASTAPAPSALDFLIRLSSDFLLPAMMGLPLWLLLLLHKKAQHTVP